MEFHLEYATEERVRQLAKERGEPDWLWKDRLRALKAFNDLPVEPLQLFVRHTDIRGLDVGKAEPLALDPAPVNPVYDGGEATAAARVEEGRLKEVRITSKLKDRDFHLNEATRLLEEKPELARKVLARPDSLPGNDKFGWMSRALHQRALVLYIPPRVEITKPILLRWRFSPDGVALLTRTLIHLAPGSRASVIEEFDSPAEGEVQGLFGNATEVYLEDGANLHYAAVERFDDRVVAFQTRQAMLQRDTALNQALGGFGGFLTKSRADTLLQGRGSSIRQVEVIYGSGKERFDNTNFVFHQGEDTVSEVHSKAVMQEASRSALKGVITIEATALHSDSYLSQYAMLLSKKSKSTAIPSLEIKTNEVQRAKHSASVAQVDEDQVFYLMSRGVPREEARKMLVEGFLVPLVDQVELEPARDRLYELIDAKWVG